MSIYIDTEWASLAKAGEELCGDHVEVVRTAEALVAVLADGLGSGVKANILSTLTAKIIAIHCQSAKKGIWPILLLRLFRLPGKGRVMLLSSTTLPSSLYGLENYPPSPGKNGRSMVSKFGKANFR